MMKNEEMRMVTNNAMEKGRREVFTKAEKYIDKKLMKKIKAKARKGYGAIEIKIPACQHLTFVKNILTDNGFEVANVRTKSNSITRKLLIKW